VVIGDCNGSAGQDCSIEAGGTLQINGKCMDIYRDEKTNKAPVELWTCTGGANQQWKLTRPDPARAADQRGQPLQPGIMPGGSQLPVTLALNGNGIRRSFDENSLSVRLLPCPAVATSSPLSG
jgi:hypothetical protein